MKEQGYYTGGFGSASPSSLGKGTCILKVKRARRETAKALPYVGRAPSDFSFETV